MKFSLAAPHGSRESVTQHTGCVLQFVISRYDAIASRHLAVRNTSVKLKRTQLANMYNNIPGAHVKTLHTTLLRAAKWEGRINHSHLHRRFLLKRLQSLDYHRITIVSSSRRAEFNLIKWRVELFGKTSFCLTIDYLELIFSLQNKKKGQQSCVIIHAQHKYVEMKKDTKQLENKCFFPKKVSLQWSFGFNDSR